MEPTTLSYSKFVLRIFIYTYVFIIKESCLKYVIIHLKWKYSNISMEETYGIGPRKPSITVFFGELQLFGMLGRSQLNVPERKKRRITIWRVFSVCPKWCIIATWHFLRLSWSFGELWAGTVNTLAYYVRRQNPISDSGEEMLTFPRKEKETSRGGALFAEGI